MAEYSITFARSARKELESLPPKVAGRVLHAIEGLAENPMPRGCRKLRGATDLWRIRVSDYRIVYTIDEHREVIDIVVIRHRRDVYR